MVDDLVGVGQPAARDQAHHAELLPARMFDEPMLRDSPSSIASMTSTDPGASTFMNASEVMVPYHWLITFCSIFGSRLLVGMYRAVTAMPTVRCVNFSVSFQSAWIS